MVVIFLNKLNTAICMCNTLISYAFYKSLTFDVYFCLSSLAHTMPVGFSQGSACSLFLIHGCHSPLRSKYLLIFIICDISPFIHLFIISLSRNIYVCYTYIILQIYSCLKYFFLVCRILSTFLSLLTTFVSFNSASQSSIFSQRHESCLSRETASGYSKFSTNSSQIKSPGFV